MERMFTPLLVGLMHWPAPMKKKGGADKEWDWRDTWKSMENLFKAHPDKLKAIGVSNFSVEFLEELFKISTVVPAANQVELHPYVMLAICIVVVTELICLRGR